MSDPVRYVTAESLYPGQTAIVFETDGLVHRYGDEAMADRRHAWGFAAEGLAGGRWCWRDSRGGLWASEAGARTREEAGWDGE